MSEYNMSHTGRELDDAINKVKNGFIDKDKAWLYSMESKFAKGTYTPSSDTPVTSANITVGFKPKLFIIRNNTAITTNGSKYYVLSSYMILDNNYEIVTTKPDGSTDVRTIFTSGIYYGNSLAASLQTHNYNYCFEPADNGVSGNGTSNSSAYFKGKATYYWWAWG